MRIIEKCWVNLGTGYQTALSLESDLRSKWKRAVEVAQRRENLMVRTKKRQNQRIAAVLFLANLVICLVLWVVQVFIPENRFQIWLYLCILMIPAVVTGGFFLYFNGVSYKKTLLDSHPTLKLTDEWWKSLQPKKYVEQKHGDRGEIGFLHSLSFLDNNHIAVWKLLTSAKITSDTDVLVLGPSGIWVFEIKYWNGRVSKQDGVWSRVLRGEKTTYLKSPDKQWLDQKNEIAKTLKIRIPSKAWMADLIKGGVVFAHPDVEFDHIDGHAASYGKPGAWRKRLRDVKPVKGFGVEEHLQVLDALIAYANLHEREEVITVSAVDVAKQLYDKTSVALRGYVSKRVR